MAREKGTASLSANIEAQKAAPLDARNIVDTKADLLLAATWTANDGSVYAYKGMRVTVHSDGIPANNGLYWLKAGDYTNPLNWEKLESGVPSAVNAASEIKIVDAPFILTPVLTLSNAPIGGSESVILNGITLTSGIGYDYTVSGNVITFEPAVVLTLTDKIEVKYLF